jgi:hypothetical protein
MLKKFATVPGAGTIVTEEVAALGKNRKTTPTKLNGIKIPTTPKAKKRISVRRISTWIVGTDRASEEGYGIVINLACL